MKNPLFYLFSPYKSIWDQIWPCRKVSQGQLRVIIWTNLVVLEHPMLHTKFQSHRPFGSREEDFYGVLPYMGMVAILVMWPGPFEQTFVPSSHGGYKWNLASIGFLKKNKIKCWIWVTLNQGQWMTLTFDIHIDSCNRLVNSIYQRWHHRIQ